MECIFGCADDGFTSHIEAGVDDDRASRALEKRLKAVHGIGDSCPGGRSGFERNSLRE